MSPAEGGSHEPRLPDRPSLGLLGNLAKSLRKSLKSGDPQAIIRFQTHHPKYRSLSRDEIRGADPSLRDAQLVVAREHGFDNWTALKEHVSAAGNGERVAAIRALCEAAGSGDVRETTRLLDKHPDIVDSLGGRDDRTPLHFAAWRGHRDVVELLLQRGADPSVRCVGDRATPLHFAAENGHVEVLRLLLEDGADPDGEGDLHEMNVIGWATVFHATSQEPGRPSAERRDEVVALLRDYGARHTIWSAVALADEEVIREVIAREPEALRARMSKFERRRSPLHLAVIHGRPDIVRLLIDLGADLEVEDDDGLTALDHAALAGAKDLADRLIGAGARMTLPSAIGLNREADIERLLGESDGALKAGGKWEGLIYLSCRAADGRVIQALIDRGADVNAVNAREHSSRPLHQAAYHNNRSAAEALIRNGADLAARDKTYDGTPLGWARHAGHPEMVDWLKQQGAA